MRSSNSSRPVSMMIPTSDVARISRASVRPSSPGMTTSSRMTSTGRDFSCSAHLRAIRGGADPIALLLEIAGEHLTNPRIVVDNKNLDGLFCRLDH